MRPLTAESSISFEVLGLPALLDTPPGPLAERFGKWLEGFVLAAAAPPAAPPRLRYALVPVPGRDGEGNSDGDCEGNSDGDGDGDGDGNEWQLLESDTSDTSHASDTSDTGDTSHASDTSDTGDTDDTSTASAPSAPAPIAQGSPPLLFAALQDQLIWRMGDTDAGSRALVHAAALARGGRAVILAGDSHAGKTSLAVTLLGLGFAFLSDEVVALDLLGRVLGCPFPLRLRQSARRHLELLPGGPLAPPTSGGPLAPPTSGGPLAPPTSGGSLAPPTSGGPLAPPTSGGPLDLDSEPFTHHGEPTLIAQVTAAHRAPTGSPIPVVAIVWPRLVSPRDRPSLEQALVPPGEATLRLLGAIFNGQALGERGLDIAAALGRAVPCVTMTGSDLALMGDAIAALV
ncbi:MAG: hypothetical protein RBU30_25205 [Polyangia bacterium]|nr:hypothetical protein [Polyangia bacterium]